jgi:crotonobetainyl-CoA:carnitine CoA-transferase CaiB-like acyl-CoA transferase
VATCNISVLDVLTGLRNIKEGGKTAVITSYGTLDEYIATLSAEEKEQYRDLIEECKQRDEKIRVDSEKRKHSLQRFAEVEEHLLQTLTELDSASQRLLQQTSVAYLKMLNANEMKCS